MPEFEFTVASQDQGTRLDIYLYRQIYPGNPELSRTILQKLILKGNVKVNHAFTKPHHKVKTKEVVTLKFETEKPSARLKPHALPLQIIYQDKYLAVINKPIGLVVHAGAGSQPFTLTNILLHHFKNLSTVNPERPGIVHRLDKDTSGLMVVARDNQTHLALAKDFAQHNIERKYVALVKGTMDFDENIIELPIMRSPREREKMAVGFSKNARYAKTYYRTIKRSASASLVELRPFTGRTHQLRVHLAFIGHPILGDTKYGKNNQFSRLALHALALGFLHPATKKFLEFSTPIPDTFLACFKD